MKKKNSIEKVQSDRDDLISSWQNAQKARNLKQKLDEISMKGNYAKAHALGKDKSETEIKDLRQRREPTRSVSPSPIYENQTSTKQLTSKIHKAIQNAKEVRKNITKSTSPLKKY